MKKLLATLFLVILFLNSYSQCGTIGCRSRGMLDALADQDYVTRHQLDTAIANHVGDGDSTLLVKNFIIKTRSGKIITIGNDTSILHSFPFLKGIFFKNPTGTSLQYIKGDGTLGTFPTITIPTIRSVLKSGNILGDTAIQAHSDPLVLYKNSSGNSIFGTDGSGESVIYNSGGLHILGVNGGQAFLGGTTGNFLTFDGSGFPIITGVPHGGSDSCLVIDASTGKLETRPYNAGGGSSIQFNAVGYGDGSNSLTGDSINFKYNPAQTQQLFLVGFNDTLCVDVNMKTKFAFFGNENTSDGVNVSWDSPSRGVTLVSNGKTEVNCSGMDSSIYLDVNGQNIGIGKIYMAADSCQSHSAGESLILLNPVTGETAWRPSTGGGNAWSLTGNAGTDPTVNFLGTTDDAPLRFKINNTSYGILRIDDELTGLGHSAGSGNTGISVVGIGQAAAQSNAGSDVVAIGNHAAFGNTFNKVIALGLNSTPTDSNEFNLSDSLHHIHAILNGVTAGNVLTSDAAGNWTSQALSAGADTIPALQAVTDKGNFTTDSINNIDGSARRAVSIYNVNQGFADNGFVRMNNTVTPSEFSLLSSQNWQFNNNSGTVSLEPPANIIFSPRLVLPQPDTARTYLVAKVNGHYPDSSGNVNVSGGSSSCGSYGYVQTSDGMGGFECSPNYKHDTITNTHTEGFYNSGIGDNVPYFNIDMPNDNSQFLIRLGDYKNKVGNSVPHYISIDPLNTVDTISSNSIVIFSSQGGPADIHLTGQIEASGNISGSNITATSSLTSTNLGGSGNVLLGAGNTGVLDTVHIGANLHLDQATNTLSATGGGGSGIDNPDTLMFYSSGITLPDVPKNITVVVSPTTTTTALFDPPVTPFSGQRITFINYGGTAPNVLTTIFDVSQLGDSLITTNEFQHPSMTWVWSASYLNWFLLSKQDTPIIVSSATGNLAASNYLTGQTTANSSIATFMPASTGSYAIGGNVTITAISAGTLVYQVTYTDETSTSRTQTFVMQGLTSGSLTTTGVTTLSDMTIRAKAATPITVLTTFTGVSVTYNVGAHIISLGY